VLRGDDLAFGAVGLQRQIGRLMPPLGGAVVIGVQGEVGWTWRRKESPAVGDLLVGGTVYLGTETYLGPVYLGYGLVEGGTTRRSSTWDGSTRPADFGNMTRWLCQQAGAAGPGSQLRYGATPATLNPAAPPGFRSDGTNQEVDRHGSTRQASDRDRLDHA
jgi:hypothetical protein